MINVVKQQNGNVLTIKLSGSIEETAAFEKLLGPPAPEMIIHCKEVSRMNSVGVKNWMKYFSDARAKGSKVRLVECSPVVVQQINMISNFISGAIVESIFVPFSCTSCKSELLGLYKTADLKKIQFKIPDVKCSKCGSQACFDDIAEEYFGFLMR